jgi:hypothetical protein
MQLPGVGVGAVPPWPVRFVGVGVGRIPWRQLPSVVGVVIPVVGALTYGITGVGG